MELNLHALIPKTIDKQRKTQMKNTIKMFAAITLMAVAVANSASAQNSWSFVMLGDTRGADNTSNGVSPYLNAMAQEIASLNPRPQFVIVAGDMCNGNCLNTNSPLYPAAAAGNFTNEVAKAIYKGFFTNWQTAMQPVYDYNTRTGTPIYTVRGNHESNDTGQAPIEVLKEAYKEMFSSFVPTNGPNNSPTNDESGFSWSLTTNNVTFVAADQYFNFDPGSTNTPWSGYHYLDQAWVTQQLQLSTSPYKIFIAHEPIFQTEGNGPGEEENQVAQHFFGTNAAAMLTRSNFWNNIGDAGAQLFLCGHLHLETVAATTNNHDHTIIQLTAGNGGAPPQDFINIPEAGVTTLWNNGNYLVINLVTNPPNDVVTNVSIVATFGFSLATVTDEKMTIQYYSLNTTSNTWTVADYTTVIASSRAKPTVGVPSDPRAGTFNYTRSDPAGTGLDYRVETSPDLSTWTNAPATQTVTATANNTQTVQVTLGGTKPLTAQKLFIRVVAQ
jgi:hypothetical protein